MFSSIYVTTEAEQFDMAKFAVFSELAFLLFLVHRFPLLPLSVGCVVLVYDMVVCIPSCFVFISMRTRQLVVLLANVFLRARVCVFYVIEPFLGHSHLL